MREFVNNDNKELNKALRMMLHVPIIVNYFIQTNYSGESEFVKEFKNIAKSYWKRDDTPKVNNSTFIVSDNTSKVDNSTFTELWKIIYDDTTPLPSKSYYNIFMSTFIDAVPSLEDWFTGRVYVERNWPDGRDSETKRFTLCEIDENEEDHPHDMNSMVSSQFGWKQFKVFVDPLSGKTIENNSNYRSTIIKFPKVLTFAFATGHKKEIAMMLSYGNGTNNYNLMAANTKDDVIYKIKDQWYINTEKCHYDDILNRVDTFTIAIYTTQTPPS